MSEPARSVTPPADICAALRQAILCGEYPFGFRLKIDELARRFGVSHMPVRKALLQLEGEHLVTTSPNRGASVRTADIESVGHTFDIVMVIEALLARRAVEHMTPDALTRLSDVENDFERAVANLDQAGVAEINIAFHQIISEQAGNREAAGIVDRNLKLLGAFRVFGFDASRLPGVVADHRSLIRAFAERDAEGAAAIAAGHAAKARSDLIAAIRAAGGLPPGPGERRLQA